MTLRPPRSTRIDNLLPYPTHFRSLLPGLAPALGRAARLQRLEGGDGTDLQGRRDAGAGHAAQPVLDIAVLRHRVLATGRQADPGRHPRRPPRPDRKSVV